ncbi:MAG: glutamine synthetase [Gemmatimonadetes bacterium]|uniref:Glutamine synthetase n=1 Tax=Candidatus Kutchimonas denitrificans TaxID=3056748 RepID=A0AAE5CA20_9BACT|nr:glutamine synthetase [Gemmatimonadota bacterium]NIR76066.1 glutamine synthetase [Candidatus Kutchimonas denitrificans]NIS00445.1 glutamine synthetase [Gemmatimonadota bacterium]NIT66103.1 glutamine synthetase [Gemmatimonadota bacterium]NIU54181.1 glutamine synthetase [Gemmatimonadota bacterium]
MNMTRRSDTPPRPGGRFEEELGKPRSEWTLDDVLELADRHRIVLLSLMHVGGDGWLKALDFVPGGRDHLRDIVQGGERADGSSLFPDTGIPTGASDIVLRPRLDTGFIDPFAPRPTLVLMCGHADRDGAPLPQSPDTIVRRAFARLKEETGIELWGLGEVEYFLGKRWDETDIYGADDRGYHATAPFVFGEELRREAMGLLRDIGVPVKYGHSEVGYIEARETEGVIWEQHEIELGLAPLPAAADAILLAQWVLRNLAQRNGMRCSTDPMMLEGHAGNGLHFHFAPMQNGRNVPIREGDSKLSDPARWLIGGLVEMGEALMAFGNRVEGSFARLNQAKEAPNRISWGEFDRNALVRLPITATDQAGRQVTMPTIEFRLPDGSALPHLLMAGVAVAMLQSRKSGDLDELLQRTSASAAAAARDGVSRVPRSFAEVAEALTRHRASLEASGAFPATLLDRTIARLTNG